MPGFDPQAPDVTLDEVDRVHHDVWGEAPEAIPVLREVHPVAPRWPNATTRLTGAEEGHPAGDNCPPGYPQNGGRAAA